MSFYVKQCCKLLEAGELTEAEFSEMMWHHELCLWYRISDLDYRIACSEDL